jgi:hypothetical protein
MTQRGGSVELVALRSRWRRWTAIVELFASRRGRCRVSPQAYRALHGELTGRCRSLSASADGPSREFCRGLEDLVQPWMNTGALAKADREILNDLLARCRLAERELRERTRGPASRRRCAAALASTAIVAGSVLLARGVGRGWAPVPGLVKGWSDLTWSTIGTSSGTAPSLPWSIIVIPASLAVFARVARR